MNDLKNDTNLREAVSRREQQQPLLTDGVNERLTQRLQQETADLWRQDETATATNSCNSCAATPPSADDRHGCGAGRAWQHALSLSYV